MTTTLKDRIQQRLDALGISARAASLQATGSDGTIRNILTDKSADPRLGTLQKLAPVLQTSVDWLLYGDDTISVATIKPEAARVDMTVPERMDMPRDVPVWGSAAGSIINSNIEGVHIFTGEPVEYVRRPPALASVRDAYAIYVTGDSMAPRHNNGDLCFVHPHRPPSPGDTVIVQTRNWDHDPGQGYIKTFRRRKAEEIILEQLNPVATITVPMRFVVALHRVMTLNDLFGV